MKPLFLALLILVSVPAFSGKHYVDMTSAERWETITLKSAACDNFSAGYIAAAVDLFPWTVEDRRAWGMISIAILGDNLATKVTEFYKDPAHADVSHDEAILTVVKRQIAKYPEGSRLLMTIGAVVN